MTEICRLCFNSGDSSFTPLNLEDGSPHRKQLDVVFPEIDLEAVPSPVLCSNCSLVLESAYTTKNTWLECEKKLQRFIERNSNLNFFCLSDVVNEVFFDDNKTEIRLDVKEEESYDCMGCSKTFVSSTELHLHLQKCFGKDDVDGVEKREMEDSDVGDELENYVSEVSDEDEKVKIEEDKICDVCSKYDCTCECRCGICLKRFETSFKLQRHKLTHKSDRPRPYSCGLCGKSFFVKSALYNHQATHSNSREFSCDHCEAGFASKKYLQDHMRRVHLKKEEENVMGQHPCEICLKVFNTEAKMKRHRVRHEQRERSHICNVCQQRFFTKSNLSNHMATHVDVKEFSCEFCGLCFASRKYLNEHMRRVHNVLRRKVYKPNKPAVIGEFECDLCNRKFTQKRYVMQHISNIHLGIKRKRILKSLRCETCGQIFTSNNLLTLHIRTHTGERPYKCDECEKSFAQASSLKTHKQAIHSNEKPFTCEYCGKKFATKGMLLKHIQAVHIADTIPKNHKCTFCGKAFRAKSQMMFHMRWHTNDRRFSCDICGKSFVNNACLKKHRAIHFNEKAHKCEICGKGFHQKFNLKIHMKVHLRIE